MSTPVVLHGLGGAPGSDLAKLLGEGLAPLAPLPGGSRLGRLVAAVTAPEQELAAVGSGLPPGPARPEALAQRLRGAGLELQWGEPILVADLDELFERCRERGRSSVELVRADPSLASVVQIGSWFDPDRRSRARRRLARALPLGAQARVGSRSQLTAAADLAFWSGVRERADDALWSRLTADSYVALVYHRFAGEGKPGQERIDIDPKRFGRQLLALHLAGYRPLSGEAVLDFHSGRGGRPGRAVAITVDDGTADCVEPLTRRRRWLPQLFVPTAELGGAAHWIDGEPVASWEQIAELERSGVRIGSHTRHHRMLTGASPAERRDELEGSLAELRERLPRPLETLAYPNGDHDEAVCRAAAEAGYLAAYTTEKGRNGAGADPHRLRRVSVHAADGIAAILWKAATGEALPEWWMRLRSRLGA